MTTLKQIYSKYSGPDGNGDKGTCHSYMDLYEEHIVNKKDCSILEIGICEGYSLALWQEFLTEGDIWGIDVYTARIKFDLNRCHIINGDATNAAVVDSLGAKRFDYIIDDGSHFIDHQIKSFQLLFKFLKEGGKYFIEDVRSENSDVLKLFLDSQEVNYECYDFSKKSGRNDDIIFLIKQPLL